MSSRTAAARASFELIKMLLSNDDGIFPLYRYLKSPKITRRSYKRKLNKFLKFGLIKKSEFDGSPVFVITAKAKFLRRKAVVKKNRTDELSTLIIFDIPEQKRNARNTLRRYLIRSGYTQIRESCFLSPFEVAEDLRDLISELKLQKDVSLFSAKMNQV